MTNLGDKYNYRVLWSDEDKEYVGLCAEFPSLSWLSPTPEAALKGIRKVIKGVLKDMKDRGESPPEALSNRKFSGKFVVRIPPELHRNLAIEAQEQGISLNRLVNAKLHR
ncbi:MAG: type II toxin-antitoxin system HicB family antitoxin [Elusimicrobiota bacterium]